MEVMVRKSFGSTEELALTSSSRDRAWDGIVVEEFDVAGDSEITLPAQDHHAIAMIRSGVTDCVQRRDAKIHHSTVRAGTAMIVPAGVASYFSSSRDHKSSRAEISRRLLSRAAEVLKSHSGAEPELRSVFECHDSFIERVISLLLEELREPVHPAQALIVGGLSIGLATHLIRTFDAREAPFSKAPASLTPRQLAAVLDYCESHIETSIGLADLAAVANVSRFHFIRLFKASTGISPMAYVERSRVDRAIALIRAGKMRLSDVAVATGFADQSHFTKRFRLHTGVTPGRFERDCEPLRARTL